MPKLASQTRCFLHDYCVCIIELRGVLALDFVKYINTHTHTQTHKHMHTCIAFDSGLELHIKDVEYIAVM